MRISIFRRVPLPNPGPEAFGARTRPHARNPAAADAGCRNGVRIALAEQLADDPAGAARPDPAAGRRPIEVARPIILRSRKLTDRELLDFIADADDARQTVCAARPEYRRARHRHARQKRRRAGARRAGAQCHCAHRPAARSRRWSKSRATSPRFRSRSPGATTCPSTLADACAHGFPTRSNLSRRKRKAPAGSGRRRCSRLRSQSVRAAVGRNRGGDESAQTYRQARDRRVSCARASCCASCSRANSICSMSPSRSCWASGRRIPPDVLSGRAQACGAGLPRRGHRQMRLSNTSFFY